MAWLEAAVVKYGWVWIGLTFGFAAKYALLIKRGIPVRPRLVMADVLLLPMVALLSYEIITRAGAHGELAALITAFCAVSADRLIKLLTERFLKQVEAATLRDLNRELVEEHGHVRQTVQTVISAKSIVEAQPQQHQQQRQQQGEGL